MSASAFPLLVLSLLGALVSGTWGAQEGAPGLSSLAPAAGEFEVWYPVGDSQQFEGLNLYELINGGAEVYHEYGFRRVLAQEYGDEGRRYISLEIYEMADPAAAFGIFSFRTGSKGEPVPLGTEAVLAGHYLNIWKERYLVTLSGVEEDEATRAGLMAVGGAVCDRIQAVGPRPDLMLLLPVAPSPPAKVWYLGGDLALANLAPVPGLAPLGFTEGAGGDYGGFRLFLLRYVNPEFAADHFAPVSDRLAARGLKPAGSPTDSGRGIRFEDGNDAVIHLEQVDRFILVTAGKENADTEATRDGLRKRLANPGND